MSTKVVTRKVRFSFVHVFEPQEPINGGDPKYSVTLLIPKSDTVTLGKIQEAMKEARDNFCNRNGQNALPLNPINSLYDGDGERKSGEPFGPECAGHYVINVTSKQKPVIVDAMLKPIEDPAEVYSGCYGRASINFFGYNASGSKGISAGLLSVQKLHDGEPFGTIGSADDFNDGYIDEDDDDFLV